MARERIRVTVTYDVITEDSAEHGDTADGGFIDPRTERRRSLRRGGKREHERTLKASRAGRLDWTLRAAIEFIDAQNCGHHETCWCPENNHCGLTVYSTDAYETHSTDAQPGVLSINYALHVTGLSDGSFIRLARALKANNVHFANFFRAGNAINRTPVTETTLHRLG